MFRVVRAEIPHPAVLDDSLDLLDRLFQATLIEAGFEIEMEQIIPQPVAARPGLDPREVDVAVGKSLQEFEQQAGIVDVRIDDERGFAARIRPFVDWREQKNRVAFES